MNPRNFFQSARDVVSNTAGTRPDVLKVLIGFGIIDILMTVVFFVTGAVDLPMRTNLAAHSVIIALTWGLLWLLWMGSKPARIGLFVYGSIGWGSTAFSLFKNGLGTPIGFAGDITNLFVTGTLCVLLWLPSMSAWLSGVAARRKELPLDGEKAFLKCAILVGLAWTFLPVVLATGGKHSHQMQGSPLEALVVSLPLVALGLVVLAVQGVKWFRLRKPASATAQNIEPILISAV